MKAWDIFSFQPPGWPGAHPAVIVSHRLRVTNKADVNVVVCSSQRARRDPEPHEVLLDEADGLDWPTLCKCDLLYSVSKQELQQRRGHVTEFRRRQIIATIHRAMDWV